MSGPIRQRQHLLNFDINIDIFFEKNRIKKYYIFRVDSWNWYLFDIFCLNG